MDTLFIIIGLTAIITFIYACVSQLYQSSLAEPLNDEFTYPPLIIVDVEIVLVLEQVP